MKLYPVIDPVNDHEKTALGIFPSESVKNVMAVATGERRPPKRGEWYLSGAIVEAYRAPADLTTEHVIARLVLVRKRVEFDILAMA